MSAFIVSEKHLDVMIQYGLYYGKQYKLRWTLPGPLPKNCYAKGQPWGPAHIAVMQERSCELTSETASRVGTMLWNENCLSVDHRYNETGEAIYYQWTTTKMMSTKVMNSIDIIKLTQSYMYQSCEHPEWKQSEAYAFCQALIKMAINYLPGYNDAPWRI